MLSYLHQWSQKLSEHTSLNEGFFSNFVKHLTVLLNLSFFTSSYLIQLVILLMILLFIFLALRLLLWTLTSILLLHFIVKLLDVTQHLNSSVSNNEE